MLINQKMAMINIKFASHPALNKLFLIVFSYITCIINDNINNCDCTSYCYVHKNMSVNIINNDKFRYVAIKNSILSILFKKSKNFILNKIYSYVLSNCICFYLGSIFISIINNRKFNSIYAFNPDG